jgi:hypothetical protein
VKGTLFVSFPNSWAAKPPRVRGERRLYEWRRGLLPQRNAVARQCDLISRLIFRMSVLTRGRRFSGTYSDPRRALRFRRSLLFIYSHNQVEIGGKSSFQILGKEFLDQRSG